MTFSKRKLYYSLKTSMIDFFTAPVRHLKDVITKESQFEKPYRTNDYPVMHLNLPTPDWPTWRFDPSKRKRVTRLFPA